MSSDQRFWVVLAGVVSCSLFLLAAGGMISSLLLIYAPFLPLLLVGLMLGVPSAFLASGVASGLSGLGLQSLGAGVMFLIIFAIPTLIYLRQTLTQITLHGQPLAWYPQGLTLTRLTYYAATLVAVMTLALYSATNGSGLDSFLPATMEGEPAWMDSARRWLDTKAYFVFGGTAWIQLSIFYGLAVLANAILGNYQRTLRPHLTITPFIPGGMLLVALMSAGIASFSANAALALAAKSVFITLLYPYFLMGLSQIHRYSLLWPSRSFWLTLVYFFLLTTLYPVLGVIGLGLAAQARHLSNRSSGSGQAS